MSYSGKAIVSTFLTKVENESGTNPKAGFGNLINHIKTDHND